jgi:predicted XRE-type DNA-binding protein
MARKRIEVEAGSGNVFADLGYPDAKERSLKVELAMEVNRLLGERGLAQDRAAKLLGIRQPHVSDLVRYRLNRFSVERLMDFLTRLGMVAASKDVREVKGMIERPRKPVSVVPCARRSRAARVADAIDRSEQSCSLVSMTLQSLHDYTGYSGAPG